MPPLWRMCVAAAQRAQGFVPPDNVLMVDLEAAASRAVCSGINTPFA